MRVHVVSDVHGAVDALARAGDGADALVCLGDLVLFLDYADHSRGIFPDLFGAENADRIVELRTARRFDEARELSPPPVGRASTGTRAIETGGPQAVRRAVRRLPHPDLRHLRQRRHPRPVAGVRPPRHHRARRRHASRSAAGSSASSAAACPPRCAPRTRSTRRPTPPRSPPSARSTCSARHIPPAVPELCYDTVARRFERGSEALLDAIHAARPRYALFGHVHQPLQPADADRAHRVRQRRPFQRHPHPVVALRPGDRPARARAPGGRCVRRTAR